MASVTYRKLGIVKSDSQYARLEQNGRYQCVGWSLGTVCPFKCQHCYSREIRHGDAELSTPIVRRVVSQLSSLGTKCVTLGGNEPIYTNGLDPRMSILPYIIDSLADVGIQSSLVTSGPSVTALHRHFPESLSKLSHVCVSLDSPREDEHNANRGAQLYAVAHQALGILSQADIPTSILYVGHSANFDIGRLNELLECCREYDVLLRVNTFKPTSVLMKPKPLSAKLYWEGFNFLTAQCESVLVGDPVLRWLLGLSAEEGCPCGRTTFRISNLDSEGVLPVTPCIYCHSHRVGDLLTMSLRSILELPAFQHFRRRSAVIHAGRSPAEGIAASGGGCAAQGLLARRSNDISWIDPILQDEYTLTPFTQDRSVIEAFDLLSVFGGYQCTWIGRP
jgi:MoaA/NifB/PqqE/SkfB family radical SAM enzyme